jgi:hypothetical protein
MITKSPPPLLSIEVQRFAPFANESDVITVGDLSIENHEGNIALVGDWTIERTKLGLAKARVLADVMQRAIEVMNGDVAAGKLPDSLPPIAVSGSVSNPFL